MKSSALAPMILELKPSWRQPLWAQRTIRIIDDEHRPTTAVELCGTRKKGMSIINYRPVSASSTTTRLKSPRSSESRGPAPLRPKNPESSGHEIINLGCEAPLIYELLHRQLRVSFGRTHRLACLPYIEALFTAATESWMALLMAFLDTLYGRNSHTIKAPLQSRTHFVQPYCSILRPALGGPPFSFVKPVRTLHQFLQ